MATKTEITDAIISNATRLLDDAKLLQANGRFGSATSLAVLAFEEAGKAIEFFNKG